MNILVCVKQVPNTQEIKIDPVTNTLIREGVESIVNPFDAYALEAAARLKDRDPENVTIFVLSMGPPQAEAALRECLGLAADAAYLASDRAFGGSDTLATSYILSQAVKKIEKDIEFKFDMIFCGKQAIDGDTAQVGPEMAEILDLPQVTYGLTCEVKENELYVTRETEDGKEVVAVRFPCLVTFTKPDFEPRFASAKRRFAAKKMPVNFIGADDIADIDRSRIGLKGSPTQVRRTFVPEQKKGGTVFRDGEWEDNTRSLAQMLIDNAVVVNMQ